MTEEIEQKLQRHYNTRSLQRSQVEAILEHCEPARQILRWKRLAIAGFGTAAVAIASLLIVVSLPQSVEPIPVVHNPVVHNEVTIDEILHPKRFQLIAVKIHADPCGRCKIIAPIFADLQNQFSADPVLFVTFDLTSNDSRRQAEILSGLLGIQNVFKKHRYTGVIVLVTPDGQIRDVVDSDTDLAMALKVVTRNLSSG